MLKTLKFSYRLRAEMFLNSLLYFLKRVPLIKRLFLKTGYEHPRAGILLTVIGMIYQVIKKIWGVALTAFIMVGVPLLILSEQVAVSDLPMYFFHMYLFLYFLTGPILNTKLLAENRTRFICIKVFRFDAKSFIFSEYITGQILEVMLEGITFTIIAGILGISKGAVFFFVVTKALFKLFFEMLDLWWYQFKSGFFHQKTVLLVVVSLGLAIAAYVPLIFKKPLPLTMPIMLGIAFVVGIIGVISMVFMSRYPLYKEAALDSNLLDKLSVSVQQVKAEAAFQNVKIDEANYTKEELSGRLYEDKNGYDYLNALFFKRHRKQLYRPVKIQTAIIALLGIVAMVVAILFPEIRKDYGSFLNHDYLTFVFIMYVLSTAPKATKALFYNCDISLLRYGFYKEKKAVLSTFTARLQNIMIANLIPAVVLAAMIVGTGLICNTSIWDMLPVGLLILVLSVFFSVHNLFLYYILQPYTTELDVKNPLFSIINTITYFLSYLCLQIEGPPKVTLFIILVLTIFYIGAALISVYRVAPKTFKVK